MGRKSLLKATPDYEDYTENVVKINDEIIKELGIMAGDYITKNCCGSSYGRCNSGGGCGASGGCECGKKQSSGKNSTKSCCRNRDE